MIVVDMHLGVNTNFTFSVEGKTPKQITEAIFERPFYIVKAKPTTAEPNATTTVVNVSKINLITFKYKDIS